MITSTLSVTQADVTYFQTFGFLHLRGVQRDLAPEISAAFERVFAAAPATVGAAGRLGISRIAERDQVLREMLLADDRCPALARQLLGTKAAYVSGDGVRYGGNSDWHRDGYHSALRLLKIVQYLEPLRRQTGALRIVPGTHRRGTCWDRYTGELADPVNRLGLLPHRVPSYVIESEPGDLIAFDPYSYHASFGGSDGRRQITVTFAAVPACVAAKRELAEYLMADRSVL
jgi:hypothetical protein